MKKGLVLIKSACAIFLFLFNSYNLMGQNVGIGNATPKEKLDVSGNIIIDSTLFGKYAIFEDTNLNRKIVVDAKNGFLQMWSNDTLWYELKTNSPTEVHMKYPSGDLNMGFTYDGPYEETRDEFNNFISRKFIYYDNGNVYVEQYYDGPCLKWEKIKKPDSDSLVKIFYKCPSGDTLKLESTYYFEDPIFSSLEYRVYYPQYLMGLSKKIETSLIPAPHIDVSRIFEHNGDTKSMITENYNDNGVGLTLENEPSNTKGIIHLDNDNIRLRFGQNSDSIDLRLNVDDGLDVRLPDGGELTFGSSPQGSGVRKVVIFQNDSLYVDHRPAERTLEYSASQPQPTDPPFIVNFDGLINKMGGSFRIDHPLDPYNKLLYHSFVESPDMMNMYNGNIITDENGFAEITLPNYFEALNTDFRYQLTVIGQFSQAIIQDKIANNKFTIRTDKPKVEVSWLVTGVRNDAFAQRFRIIPEVKKGDQLRGKLLFNKALNQH